MQEKQKERRAADSIATCVRISARVGSHQEAIANDGLRKITQYFLNSIIDPCDPAKHAHDEREKTQPKIASASIKRTKTQTQITEPRGNRYALNVRETERHHTHDAAVHRSEDRRREIWR